MIEAANLGWRDVAIGPVVQERVGVPVSLRHDVRAAALAEGLIGAARGCDDYLLLAPYRDRGGDHAAGAIRPSLTVALAS